MKIQEMRSGLAHLPKRSPADSPGEDFSDLISRKDPSPAQRPHGLTLATGSELEEPHWSVISFSKREASGLTYKQASQRIAELDAAGIAGLCIVTDAAAEHVNP
jgi:hypothetical protein